MPVRWSRIFAGGTADIDQGAAERFRAHEDEPDRVEHLLRGRAIGRLFQIHHYVGAVKRNHRGPGPGADQREQMDRDMAEVNVQQLRLLFVENAA